MRTPTRWLGFSTIVLTLAGAPVLANPGKGGQSTTPKVQGPKAATTTTTSGAPKTQKGASGKTTPTTTTNGKSHSPKTTTTSTKTTTTTPTTTTTSGGTSNGGTSTPTDTWRPTNAVSAKVSTKPSIMTKVNTVLPTGTDLNNATLGFKNFGQFVAAVNVSNNLRIPFADLKAAMTGIDIHGLPVATTGTTGTTGASTPTTMSLGQAIHKVAPTVDSETEAQKAFTQANQQINASTTSTTTTKKTKS